LQSLLMVIFMPESEEESAIISVVFPHIVMLTFTFVVNRGLSIMDFKESFNLYEMKDSGFAEPDNSCCFTTVKEADICINFTVKL
jgi:hypothetical protein